MPDIIRSARPIRNLASVATAFIIGLLLAAAIGIWVLRQGAIADTMDDNHRLGVVLAEQTARTLQAVDFAVQGVAERIASAGVEDANALHAKFDRLEVHEELARRLVDLPQAINIAISDASGAVVVHSQHWPIDSFSVADRDYFQHFADSADARPYISEPLIGRAVGLRTVALSRRINGPNGLFLGVVFVSIRLQYFDELLAKTGLMDGTGVTILRRDGATLVHYPAPDVPLGQRIPPGLPWYKVVAGGGGTYISPGVFNDLGRTFVSVHPLQSYAIVVDVTRSQTAALARWWRQSVAISIGVVAATIILALLLRTLTRQLAINDRSQRQIRRQIDVIQANEALLTATLEHMNQGLMVVDAAGHVAVCNKRAIEILDLPADMMATRPLFADVLEYQRLHDNSGAPSDIPLDQVTLLNSRASYERRRPNGLVMEVRTAALPNGGLVRTFSDITARAAAETMLSLAASHDQLTGLANRNGFNSRLDAALSQMRRGNGELAVMCLDLDRFKAVNDTLGHGAGDQLLIQVGQRMHAIVRATDVIGRVGGDEFAIILPGSNPPGIEQVSQRLLESIGLPYNLDGQAARIGVSIGIAFYPADGGTAEQLLQNADTALYKAKAAGRNTVCAYATADGQREHRRMQLEQDLRTAVELQQFTLAYQPICEAASRAPVAFEALLRWNHPTRGYVSPDDFIPIAEQTGLIIPLGRWVLETACAEAAAWALPLRVAVNLSPAQFRDRTLVTFIHDVLARCGLPAGRLDLEVTEGLLLEDVGNVVTTMQSLRTAGIRMVLDDFGTAHSNLSYLRGFPFDGVKIDRSFLRALNTDHQARALVEAMLAMARALDLEVIGEGVETQEQLALLVLLECGCVQGYLLGRPSPSEETRERIWNLATAQARTAKASRDLKTTVGA